MTEPPAFVLTGAVDVNPVLIGKDVASLTERTALRGVAVTNTLPHVAQPGRAVALVPTVSTVTQIQPQI